MDSAEVMEITEKLGARMRGVKKSMELELRPRISNFGKGIEQMSLGWRNICRKKMTSDYFKMKI